jgi:hypothetical protein
MSDRSELRDEYTALHEGRAPDRWISERVGAAPAGLHPYARITEIGYAKKIPGQTDGMYHPFTSHAQPAFTIDRRGKLWIYTGRYEVTEHGIEDLSRDRIRAERLPRAPKTLIDLGKLEYLKYKREVGQTVVHGIYEFHGADQPTLAHYRGELHVLRGRYRLRQGRDETMRAMRANPVGKALERGKSVLMSELVVGGVGLGTILLANEAFTKLTPTLSMYNRAAVLFGAGTAAAIGISMAGWEAGAMGVAVGSVIGAGGMAIQYYRQTTRPAGYSLMPQGLPAQYDAYYSGQYAMAR